MGISSNAGGVPVGAELPYHGGTIPVGYLLMYGQIVNIVDYPALFAVLGAVHGGNGTTTFGIPDSRGRNTVGKDDMGGTPANRVTVGGSGIAGATLGANGGGESVTLTAGQMPNHAHGLTNNVYGSGVGSGAVIDGGSAKSSNGSIGISASGSGGAHSNMPPSLVANKIIKAF